MAFVDYRKEILGEVVHQGKRRFPRLPSRKVPGIVFDAAAVPQLLHHLQVVIGPLFQPLGFQEMTAIFQLPEPFIQLFPDSSQGPFHFILCRDIMTGRINRHVFSFGNDFSGQHIHFGQSVNFITEHFNTDDRIIERRRKDFDGITMNAECPPFQAHIIARILDIDQLMQDFFLGLFLTEAQRNDEFAVIFRGHPGHRCRTRMQR